MKRREPWLEFETLRDRYQEQKVAARQLKQQYNRVYQQLKPKETALDKSSREQKSLKAKAADLSSQKRSKQSALDKASRGMEKIEEKIEDHEEEMNKLDRDEQKRLERMDTLKQEISSLRDDIASRSDRGEGAQAAEERKRLHRQLQAVRKAQQKAQSSAKQAKRQGNGLRSQIRGLEHDIQEASNAEQRKLAALCDGRDGSRVRNAHNWVQSNQRKFRHKVYGPLGLYITVPNQSHARFVETVVPWTVRKAFVVQCQQDANTLRKELKENQRIYPNVFIINYSDDSSRTERHSPPVPLDKLQKFGVSMYMDAMIEADQVLKRVLNDNCKLHAIAFGAKEAENNADKILSAGVSKLMTPNKLNSGTRSIHTGQVSSRVSYTVQNARVFGVSVDTSLIRELKGKHAELNQKLTQSLSEYSEHTREHDHYKQQEKELNNKEVQLREAGMAIRRLQNKLTAQQREYEKLEKKPSLEQQQNQKAKEITKLQMRLVKQLHTQTESMTEWMATAAQHDKVALQAASMLLSLRQLRSEVEQLDAMATSMRQEFEEAKSVLEGECLGDRFDSLVLLKVVRFTDVKGQLTNAKDKAIAHGEPSEEVRQLWAELPADLSELREEIRCEAARANSMVKDRRILEEHERRKEQIQLLEQQFESLAEGRERWLVSMRSLHNKWLEGEHGLRHLVAKINHEVRRSLMPLA